MVFTSLPQNVWTIRNGATVVSRVSSRTTARTIVRNLKADGIVNVTLTRMPITYGDELTA